VRFALIDLEIAPVGTSAAAADGAAARRCSYQEQSPSPGSVTTKDTEDVGNLSSTKGSFRAAMEESTICIVMSVR